MVCYGTIHRGGIKIKIPYIRISFYAYEKIEIQKHVIDILLELGQLENIFHP
jgi:hypothetical protein